MSYPLPLYARVVGVRAAQIERVESISTDSSTCLLHFLKKEIAPIRVSSNICANMDAAASKYYVIDEDGREAIVEAAWFDKRHNKDRGDTIVTEAGDGFFYDYPEDTVCDWLGFYHPSMDESIGEFKKRSAKIKKSWGRTVSIPFEDPD